MPSKFKLTPASFFVTIFQTLAFTLLALIANGQDKVILLSNDTLLGTVIKYSGQSLSFKEQSGVEREVSNYFISDVLLSTGAKLVTTRYQFIPHTILSSQGSNGHTEVFTHSNLLEQEADALFPKAAKRKLGFEVGKKARNRNYQIEFHKFSTNAFLILEADTYVLCYSNVINDLSWIENKTFELAFDEVFGSPAMSLAEQKEGKWTILFKQNKALQVPPNVELDYEYKNGKIIFIDRRKKKWNQFIYDVVYADQGMIRYSQFFEYYYRTKTLRLVK
jgi:hypothetical protein